MPGITTTATTITFHLTIPDGAFIYKTALPTTCPVPCGTPMKAIENGSLEQKYASGPFMLQSYSPGRQIVLVFNKNYDQKLGVRGHVAKIVFTIGVESSQAVLQIQAGQLDFQTSNLATADILKISNDAAAEEPGPHLGTSGHHLPVPQQQRGAAQQGRRPQGDQLRDQPDGRSWRSGAARWQGQ